MTAPIVPRNILTKHFGDDLRMITAFEEINASVVDNEGSVVDNVAATQALQDATVIVLSANEAFANERILKLAPGLKATVDDTFVTISLDSVARTEGGFAVTFAAAGDASITVPLVGTLVTFEHAGDKLGNYANDAAAAAGGVLIGGLYRNGSVVQVRVT